MTYNPKKYSALLSETLPGVIDSLDEYHRIEEIFNNLFKENRSPEEDKLFNLLANLLEDYERRTLPPLEKSSPLETLKFLMEENNLRQSDLADVFSTQSVVSDVLNGKREITKNQAKALAQKFSLRLEAFI
ncbi:MAG: helix-turn-helix domain-containing protein [Pyrinomonadaceae bacterium]